MGEDTIRELRVHLIRIPAKAVHSHGSGDVAEIRSVLLELVTEAGITGWGEAAPWPAFSGVTAEGAADVLHAHLRPYLIGQDPAQISFHLHRADRFTAGHHEAKAALETALLDIVGQASGLSVSELVGGRHRDEIPLSFSVANPDFERDLEEVGELFAKGVKIFKVKTGFAEHAFDVMRLRRLRECLGDGASLRVDYNQGLPAFDAIRRIRDLEAFDPAFVEQPVKRHEREALAGITQAVDVPIMADESVFGPEEALRGAQMRIADIFSLKIMKSGGIRRALEVAAIARAAGIEVYGGCMFETGIAHAAGTHLMAAVPDLKLGCEFYMPTYYLEEDILADPFPVKEGRVQVPQGPGLGVRVDRDRLGKWREQLLE